MNRIHFISGLIITIFVGFHLFNHCYSIVGIANHIELMTALRYFYRNSFIETILLLAVATQIYSGIKLFKRNRKTVAVFFEQVQIWSGLYLGIFLLIHVGIVLVGRYILKLDTNVYFGVAGLNTFPFLLFFIPYYGMAILSFFAHVASIHHKKMKGRFFGFSPNGQAKGILIVGFCITLFIFYGLTNKLKGVRIPTEYNILIGK